MKLLKRPFGEQGQLGASLVGSLIGVGIIGMIAVSLSKLTQGTFNMVKKVENKNDVAIIKALVNSIDCDNTLAENGINATNIDRLCKSTSKPGDQKGPWLTLYRRTITNKAKPIAKPNEDGAAPYGKWHVRASCSADDESLVVRMAKIDKKGHFFSDPVTKKILDWDHQDHLILGAPDHAGIPLCFSSGTSIGGSTKIFNSNLRTNNGRRGYRARHYGYPGAPWTSFSNVHSSFEKIKTGSSTRGHLRVDLNVNWDGAVGPWINFMVGAVVKVNGDIVSPEGYPQGSLVQSFGTMVHNHGQNVVQSWTFSFPANSTVSISPRLTYYTIPAHVGYPNVTRVKAAGTASFQLMP